MANRKRGEYEGILVMRIVVETSAVTEDNNNNNNNNNNDINNWKQRERERGALRIR